jgi:hypothetical protein
MVSASKSPRRAKSSSLRAASALVISCSLSSIFSCGTGYAFAYLASRMTFLLVNSKLHQLALRKQQGRYLTGFNFGRVPCADDRHRRYWCSFPQESRGACDQMALGGHIYGVLRVWHAMASPVMPHAAYRGGMPYPVIFHIERDVNSVKAYPNAA